MLKYTTAIRNAADVSRKFLWFVVGYIFFSFGSHGFESKLANVGNVCAGWLAGWLDFKVCDLSKSYKHLMAYLEFAQLTTATTTNAPRL